MTDDEDREDEGHDAGDSPPGEVDDRPSGGDDGRPGPYDDYDPSDIQGPLSRREDSRAEAGGGSVAGVRSSGSNGHHPPEERADDDTPAAESTDSEEPTPSFVEVQQFRQRWVWVAFGLLTVYATVTVALNDVALRFAAVFVGVPAAALCLLYVAKLRTEVDADGIHVRFFPFHRSPRTIPFEEVVEYEAVEYDPVREYYGWGIRRGLDGWAYNVSGNEGVYIEREPKVDVLVGSQRPDDLEDAVALGVATSDTIAHHGGDRGAKWRAVAQFREEDEDVREFHDEGDR